MKIHPGAEHMRIYNEYFLTIWTSDFNGLTHGYLSLYFSSQDCLNPLLILPVHGRNKVGLHHAQ
jgi:hypothetical protein